MSFHQGGLSECAKLQDAIMLPFNKNTKKSIFEKTNSQPWYFKSANANEEMLRDPSYNLSKKFIHIY